LYANDLYLHTISNNLSIMKINVLTQIVLDQRTAKKGGTFPVKLRITFQRKQKYYALNKDLTLDEFSKVNSQKPRSEYKELKLAFEAFEGEARKVINDLKAFSFEAFEKRFYEDAKTTTNKTNVCEAIEAKITALNKEGRVGSASTYQCLKSSIQSFQKKISFEDITVDWLKQYEKYMLEERKTSLTTIGIYLRSLRVIFNDAIEENIIPLESYPFGKRKYQIPTGENVKKAIPNSEIGKIYHYESDNEKELWARDMWLFSYLCNGMNIKDISHLKYKDIQGGNIYFKRAKTENTKRNQKLICCPVLPRTKEIIQKWGNKPDLAESYIFPIITEGLTAERELAVKKQANKQINTYMKRIAEKLGIDSNLATYSARHSFATNLKRLGVSTEFISESLGHTSTKTTQNYLDSFEDETRKEIAQKLISF